MKAFEERIPEIVKNVLEESPLSQTFTTQGNGGALAGTGQQVATQEQVESMCETQAGILKKGKDAEAFPGKVRVCVCFFARARLQIFERVLTRKVFRAKATNANVSDVLQELANQVVSVLPGATLSAARLAAEKLAQQQMASRLLKSDPATREAKRQKVAEGSCNVLELLDKVWCELEGETEGGKRQERKEESPDFSLWPSQILGDGKKLKNWSYCLGNAAAAQQAVVPVGDVKKVMLYRPPAAQDDELSAEQAALFPGTLALFGSTTSLPVSAAFATKVNAAVKKVSKAGSAVTSWIVAAVVLGVRLLLLVSYSARASHPLPLFLDIKESLPRLPPFTDLRAVLEEGVELHLEELVQSGEELWCIRPAVLAEYGRCIGRPEGAQRHDGALDEVLSQAGVPPEDRQQPPEGV